MISVVIPAYNHERYIGAAIQSCLAESLVTEILVADDGSKDRTLEVIEEFSRAYPGRVKNLTEIPSVNMGAHNRINSLCREATCDWIAVLNSDDMFCSGRFKNFDQYIRFRRPDLVFGNCAIIDADSNNIGSKFALFDGEFSYSADHDPVSIAEHKHWPIPLMSQNFVATTSNLVFSKALFNKLGGFRAYRYIHDWDFILRASLIGSVSYCNSMWVNYRIHSTNTISESSYKVRLEVIKMFEEICSSKYYLDYSKENNLHDALEKSRASNSYLVEESTCYVVFPGAEELFSAGLGGIVIPGLFFVNDFSLVPDDATFVYAPVSSSPPLSLNDLRNLCLAAYSGEHDIVSCSKVLNESYLLTRDALLDISIIRFRRFTELSSGALTDVVRGRIVRLPRNLPADSELISVIDLFPDYNVAREEGDFIVSGRNFNRPAFSQVPSPVKHYPMRHNADGTKPLIFVLPGVLAVGGAENVLIEILKELKEEFDFVAICTVKNVAAQGSWQWRVLEHCQAIYDLAEACAEGSMMHALAWLKATYRPRGVFVTNGTMWQMRNAFALRKLFSDAAIIDQQAYDAKFGWIEWFNHPGIQLTNKFIAVNEKIAEEFTGRFAISTDKVEFIPHPIDSRRIAVNLSNLDSYSCAGNFGIDASRPVVAFVGRLAPQKRPLLFLEVAKLAKNTRPDLQFVLVGQGVLEEDAHEFIEVHSLENVFPIRNINELEHLYACVDVLLVTSEYEGLPLAMLEAMCAGVSILATDTGDIKTVLDRYEVGEVVAVESSVDALFESLTNHISLLESTSAARNMAASLILHDFSSYTIGQKYRRVFSEALAGYTDLRSY